MDERIEAGLEQQFPKPAKKRILLPAILRWLPALGLPGGLIGLFYLLREDQALMDAWVGKVMAPAEQFLGRLWSVFPFSAAEILVTAAITGCVLWFARAVVLLVRQRKPWAFVRRLIALSAVFVWIWAGLCWMWNPSYYASDFAQKSGLAAPGHTVEELFYTTVWFAQNAAYYSAQVERDEQGRFAEDEKAYFDRGAHVYDNLVKEFPFLEIPSVRAKPLFFSRLQSALGFTGVYFPFTGEANVNAHSPSCLRPAIIAHEMAHQRMVADEAEANFVGVAAAVTSGDVVYQYSGYLFGLIELCNTLYDISPELWDVIAQSFFTPELSTDWNENRDYWHSFESEVEETAEETYDAFLRSNGQSLGIASYGACVDLLIAYFCPI